MFERYTEKARRVIFFARYEAAQAGCPYIETEHLLLGMLRESSGTMRQHLKIDPAKLTPLLTKKRTAPKVSVSVDLPLDNASKRALAYAAEEAEQMGHRHIGTEHLLLGVMREEQGEASKALKMAGAPTLAEVRKSIIESGPEQPGRGIVGTGPSALPTWVRFIEEGVGRDLSARLGSEVAPRIGEAVSITTQEGSTQRFRVLDVEWKFDIRPPGSNLTLKVVEVRLKREEQPH